MHSSLIHQIKQIFLKELKQEWRNRFALMSILLMLVVSVFIVYRIDKNASDKVWHGYFYLILLFGVVQNIGRSFLDEDSGVMLYYRSVVNHIALLSAKILYQFFVNSFFLVLLLILMNFFLDQSIPHFFEYVVTALLFTLSCATIFTFNASIAKGAKNSALVASVLSFPLLLPTLLISLSSAEKSMMSVENMVFYNDWIVLVILLVISIILSVVLFRHIWSD